MKNTMKNTWVIYVCQMMTSLINFGMKLEQEMEKERSIAKLMLFSFISLIIEIRAVKFIDLVN